jgi:SAM-dependent methyltransferase
MGRVLGREVANDVEVLERFVSVSGHDLVDVGCGGGALVRALAARGARVTGIEISESQLAAAVEGDDGAGARYLVGLAQDLPLDDATVDAVVFMRALHHVPPEHMLDGLREAAFFELTSLVEDELEVRAAAQDTIADAAGAGLDRAGTFEYDVCLRLADLDAFAARIISVDPARGEVFEERKATLGEAFARLGEPGERPGERRFLTPMRVDLLRPAGGDVAREPGGSR